jgi:hypothetical protein
MQSFQQHQAHQLSAASYQVMQQENFPQGNEGCQQFFIRVVQAGRLKKRLP